MGKDQAQGVAQISGHDSTPEGDPNRFTCAEAFSGGHSERVALSQDLCPKTQRPGARSSRPFLLTPPVRVLSVMQLS